MRRVSKLRHVQWQIASLGFILLIISCEERRNSRIERQDYVSEVVELVSRRVENDSFFSSDLNISALGIQNDSGQISILVRNLRSDNELEKIRSILRLHVRSGTVIRLQYYVLHSSGYGYVEGSEILNVSAQ